MAATGTVLPALRRAITEAGDDAPPSLLQVAGELALTAPDDHEQLLAVIAGHEHTPLPTAQSISDATSSAKVLTAYLARADIGVDEILERTKTEKRSTVLAVLAGTEGLPAGVYRSLLGRGKGIDVALFGNPSVPADVLPEVVVNLSQRTLNHKEQSAYWKRLAAEPAVQRASFDRMRLRRSTVIEKCSTWVGLTSGQLERIIDACTSKCEEIVRRRNYQGGNIAMVTTGIIALAEHRSVTVDQLDRLTEIRNHPALGQNGNRQLGTFDKAAAVARTRIGAAGSDEPAAVAEFGDRDALAQLIADGKVDSTTMLTIAMTNPAFDAELAVALLPLGAGSSENTRLVFSSAKTLSDLVTILVAHGREPFSGTIEYRHVQELLRSASSDELVAALDRVCGNADLESYVESMILRHLPVSSLTDPVLGRLHWSSKIHEADSRYAVTPKPNRARLVAYLTDRLGTNIDAWDAFDNVADETVRIEDAVTMALRLAPSAAAA